MGVSVPCRLSCAKVFSRWSGALRFFRTPQSGYQAVPLSGGVREISEMPTCPGTAVHKTIGLQSDTINQYLWRTDEFVGSWDSDVRSAKLVNDNSVCIHINLKVEGGSVLRIPKS